MKTEKTIIKFLNRKRYNNTITEAEDVKTLGSENDSFKEHSQKVRDMIGSVNITFEPMTVNYNKNEVLWSGAIDKTIFWNYVLNEETYGFYMSIDNAKMTEAYAIAIHRLNNYYDHSWMKDIRDKLQTKQL